MVKRRNFFGGFCTKNYAFEFSSETRSSCQNYIADYYIQFQALKNGLQAASSVGVKNVMEGKNHNRTVIFFPRKLRDLSLPGALTAEKGLTLHSGPASIAASHRRELSIKRKEVLQPFDSGAPANSFTKKYEEGGLIKRLYPGETLPSYNNWPAHPFFRLRPI